MKGRIRRRPLTTEMSSAEKDFLTELRWLIDAADLTVRRLEESTSSAKSPDAQSCLYSKSQWARWISGQSRPPRRAITRLVEVLGAADIHAVHLVALWDRAFAPPARTSRAAHGLVPPRQLPAPPAHFAGRTAELDALDRLADLTDTGGPVVISVIGGTAGVGKTALAVHWSHRVARRFPDGQLFADLRGYDPSAAAVTPATAVRGFLDALVPVTKRIPASVAAQTAMYRSLLAGRRMLVVLDNAQDAQQVRPLLPGSPGCMVIVTSRNQLTSLVATDSAQPLTLDLLDTADARELLDRRLGSGRMAAEPEVTAELLALCAGLPLAVCIVAALAAARPDYPLSAIAAELRDAQGRLDALDAGDVTGSVRAAFSCSYDNLSAASSRMFRLCGLHPGPAISTAAAASLAAVPLSQARRALGDLTAVALMAKSAPRRYQCHDLLRAYAQERLLDRESGPDRQAAIHRMLDHYLYTAHAAALLLSPGRDPLDLPALQPAVKPESIAGGDQALAWFEAERRVLLAIITVAADAGHQTHAWQLTCAVGRFLDRRGHWNEWYAALGTALSAALKHDDRTGQAHLHDNFGIAGARLGHYQDAHSHLDEALALYQQSGDYKGMARTHQFAGMVLEGQARYDEALARSQQALVLFRATGQHAGQADALNAIGWFSAHLGDYQKAIACCRAALRLYRELDDRHGEAAAWDSLGYAYHHLDRHARAVTSYRHALDLYRDLGNRYFQADTLTHLGDTQHSAKNLKGASTSWRQALAILDELHHPDAVAVRSRLSSDG